MPADFRTVEVIVLRTFSGAGVFGKAGSRVQFPKKWVKQYETAGLVKPVTDTTSKEVESLETTSVETETSPADESVNTTSVEPEYTEFETDVKVDHEFLSQPGEGSGRLSIDDLERRGPYYVLPNGELVNGRDAAMEALTEHYGAEHQSDDK